MKQKKKMEHLFKSISVPGNEVSVVPPGFYAERFVSFMQGLLPPDTVLDSKLIKEPGKVVKKAIRNSKYHITEDIYSKTSKTSLLESWMEDKSSDST